MLSSSGYSLIDSISKKNKKGWENIPEYVETVYGSTGIFYRPSLYVFQPPVAVKRKNDITTIIHQMVTAYPALKDIITLINKKSLFAKEILDPDEMKFADDFPDLQKITVRNLFVNIVDTQNDKKLFRDQLIKLTEVAILNVLCCMHYKKLIAKKDDDHLQEKLKSLESIQKEILTCWNNWNRIFQEKNVKAVIEFSR